MTAAEADPEKHAKQLAELDLMIDRTTTYLESRRTPSLLERLFPGCRLPRVSGDA